MTANSAGEGKLLEEFPQPLYIFGFVRVDLAIDALEIGLRDDGRGSVTRTGDEEDIEIVFFDQAVHGHIGEDLTGIGSPVTEESCFEMLDFEGFLEEGILLEVEHTQAEIETGSHVVVGGFQFLIAEGGFFDG